MQDPVETAYNRILESLGLEGVAIGDYDLLERYALIVELEKAFNISLSDSQWNEILNKDSHEVVINLINSLI
jgi:hypothetical protein